MTTVISVENLSKTYRLGQIGTGTFTHDLNLWWAKLRGKPNPMLRIGDKDHGNRDGEELWALKDISFKVEQGEVLGIIGRNGAGKSTLLKILSRVTAPTSGKIKVKGRIASLLEVGTGFHPELTGRENIYLNGAILGMSKNEVTRKFDEIVDFAGVEKFIDTPVKRYSSGMYVRLAFAVAAHLEPEILVVDEVLAVGDAEFQKKCLGKMGDVAKEGRTVLFVSHNMGAMRSICERALLIQKGCIVSDGEINLVVGNYLSSAFGSIKESGQVSWSIPENAPGTDEIKLMKARLLDTNGDTHSIFDYPSNIVIEFNYKILKSIRGMRLGIILMTEDGVVVFASIDRQSSLSEKKIGDYCTTVIIPGNLLNHKRYIVQFQSAIPNIRYLISENVLSFTITGGGELGSKNPEKWPGIIAPSLDWNTTMTQDIN